MRNKFNAKKTTVDGMVFDSRREAKRYVDFDLVDDLEDSERGGDGFGSTGK